MANGATIQYTGTAQAVTDAYNLSPPSPLWILEDPRGTGTPEWFAVVNNSSKDQIKAYATSTGSAVSAYFTKSGQINPVPFNNIVTTYMTNFGYMLLSSAFNKPISDWDTSNVTNMSQMFQAASAFNQDISKWNVAKVTDMSFMFFDADFYQDISGWITSSVKDMAHMFSGARKFDSDISGWNTSNVENMQNMFQNAKLFNQNLSGWNVAKVTNMSSMFSIASKFNGDISGWNTSNVVSMDGMFNGATLFNQNLSGWNVGKVTSRNYFASPALLATVALQPIWRVLSRLANGVTIRYTDTAQAVTDAYNLSTPSPLWIKEDPRGTGTPEWFAVVDNSSSAQITAYANSTGSAVSAYFTKSGQVNPVDFNNIVTTRMTVMSFLLNNTPFNKDISRWDTENVTSMYGMFLNNGEFNQNISSWNVANVQDMGMLFLSSAKFNQNISSWNVAKVTNMTQMFLQATLFDQNLSGWNIGKVTSRDNFASPPLLANVAFQPNWPKLSRLANEATIQYTGTAQAVTDAYNLSPPSPLWLQEDPRGTGTPQWFAVVNNSSSAQITAYAKSTGSAVSTYFTKSGQINPVPFNNIVTTCMTSMVQLFASSAFNKPISDWDTSNVSHSSGMFQGASAFEQDISKWNVAKVTNMNQMFLYASKFNSDISGWDTRNVTNMSGMFRYATLFNRNLSGWNVAKVKVTDRVDFASPALLATVALQPNWRVLSRLANGVTIQYTGTAQKVIDAYNLSTSPLWLQEDPRGTGTPQWFAVVDNSSRAQITAYAKSAGSAVSAYFTKLGQPGPVPFNNIVTTCMTNMVQLFKEASAFNKNISDWDTSNVYDSMIGMFQNAAAFDQDISRWNVAKVTDMSFMFQNAAAFDQDISGWVTSNVTNMSFMFDGATLFNRNLSGWNVGKVLYRNSFAPDLSSEKLPRFPLLSRLANGATIQYTGTEQAAMDAYNLPTPSPLWLQEDPRGTGTPEWFAVITQHSKSLIMSYANSTGSAVSAYFTKSGQINPVPFNNIVTTYMTDMSNMFDNASAFNQPLSDWDLKNTTSVHAMFYQASVFNQDISKWNVDNVLTAGYFATGSPLALPENSGKLPPRYR